MGDRITLELHGHVSAGVLQFDVVDSVLGQRHFRPVVAGALRSGDVGLHIQARVSEWAPVVVEQVGDHPVGEHGVEVCGFAGYGLGLPVRQKSVDGGDAVVWPGQEIVQAALGDVLLPQVVSEQGRRSIVQADVTVQVLGPIDQRCVGPSQVVPRAARRVPRLGDGQLGQALVEPRGLCRVRVPVDGMLQLVGQNGEIFRAAQGDFPRVDVDGGHAVAERLHRCRVRVRSRHVPADPRYPAVDDVPPLRISVRPGGRAEGRRHPRVDLRFNIRHRPLQVSVVHIQTLFDPPVGVLGHRGQYKLLAHHPAAGIVQRPEVRRVPDFGKAVGEARRLRVGFRAIPTQLSG